MGESGRVGQQVEGQVSRPVCPQGQVGEARDLGQEIPGHVSRQARGQDQVRHLRKMGQQVRGTNRDHSPPVRVRWVTASACSWRASGLISWLTRRRRREAG